MKFINGVLFIFILFSACNSKNDDHISGMYPPYRLIKMFSKKIQPETNLVLTSYGINWGLPREYEYKNGIGNFCAGYNLFKDKNDEVTLEKARALLVFLVENFLKEVNSNSEIIPLLDVYPLTSNLFDVSIHICENNKMDLGQGVARIYFSKGMIDYDRYDTAKARHTTFHKESYEEALKIVKSQQN